MPNLLVNDLIQKMGTVELRRVIVVCPECGQSVEAVSRDGKITGWCAVSRKYVAMDSLDD